MTTTEHKIRRKHFGHSVTTDYAPVTLVHVPGVVIDGDRSETEPRGRPTKIVKQPPRGAALLPAAKRRVAAFRAALIEVAQESEE